MSGYTRTQLLAEIHRLHDDLGRTPTTTDLRAHSDISITPYYSHFDGWKDAVEQAGLEREVPQQGPTKEELLDAIRELADDVDGTPTLTEMDDRGEFTRTPYYNKFDSWNAALKQAGFHPNHEYVSEAQLLEELRALADDLDRDPTIYDVNEHTDRAHTTYTRRFGSWLEAREKAGLSGEKKQFAKRIPHADLLDELDRIGELFGRAPTQAEIGAFGRFSYQSYHRRFGSFRYALETAGFELDTPDRTWPDDYPDDWLPRAKRVRERDGHECVVSDCDMTDERHQREYGEKLNVHHVHTDDGDPDDLENLVTLCKACHSKWDRVKADPRDAPGGGIAD